MDKDLITSQHQLTINSASYLLKRSKFLLSFSPFDLEKQYLEQRTTGSAHYIRTFLAFGITLAILVVGLIMLLWPDIFTSASDSPLLKINMAINVGCIALAPLLVFFIRSERFQQIYIMLLSLLFLTWKCFYPHLIEDITFSSNALYLSISYLILSAFLTKLRAFYALLTYSGVALITLLAIQFYPHTTSHLGIRDYIYATAISCLIALSLAVYQDRMLRINFLKNIILKTQQKELEQLNNRYRRLSKEDPLTGLANRRHLKERLDSEWQRLRRESGPISIIMFDIDCFKQYNDHYGHQMGDNCLRQIATCLNSVIKRPNDLSARYGGEEFIVVLPNTNEKGALSVANAIKDAITRCNIENIASTIKPVITVSLGVATLTPDEHLNQSTKTLIKLADDALYQAKAQGKDRIVVADKNRSIIQIISRAHNDTD